MVKVDIRGIHKVRARLKSGKVVEYHYAWRKGPRLEGKPGSEEYLESFRRALATARMSHDPETLAGMVASYKESAEFGKLASSTRRDYESMFAIIVDRYGDMDVAVLEDRRVRAEFKAFRNSMSNTPRKADRFWQVLKRVLNVAVDNGILKWNPAAGGGKLYHGTRADIIWMPHEIQLYMAKAPRHELGPFLCALDTGQRQGDILALKWNQYDGKMIRLVQSKTKKRVAVTASARLKRFLDEERLRQASLDTRPINIFVTSRNTPWTSDGYQAVFRKRCARIGIQDRHFNDLRGTFTTMRRREGSSIEEIASITGHSIRDVSAVLEKHYLAFDEEFGQAVILRMDGNK